MAGQPGNTAMSPSGYSVFPCAWPDRLPGLPLTSQRGFSQGWRATPAGTGRGNVEVCFGDGVSHQVSHQVSHRLHTSLFLPPPFAFQSLNSGFSKPSRTDIQQLQNWLRSLRLCFVSDLLFVVKKGNGCQGNLIKLHLCIQ